MASFASGETTQAPEALTLMQAIDFGLANNPRLSIAIANIVRAQGQVDVAFAPFLPQIDFLTHGGVTSRALGPASAGETGIILSTTTATHDYLQAELQLQWTLYDFGRTACRYQQARAQERITEIQAERARQTVGFDVASAYLLVLEAQASRRIQEEAIRRAEASLRDTRSRRTAGVAERDDVLRGEVQLAAAQEDLNLARESELQSLARVNNAMGRNAAEPLALTTIDAEPSFDLSLAQCLEVAAAQRAEIRVAREAVAAAQFGRGATRAEYLPRVYTLASVGALGGENVVNGLQEGVGLHIDLPLYTGGRRRGELRAADADIDRAIATARSILDEVSLEVTLAYVAATTARRRIELDRPAIVEARENLRLVANRYRNGQATPTDIVDAQVALTRAQQRLASASYEYLGALVGIDYALDNPPASLLKERARPAEQKSATGKQPGPEPAKKSP